MNTVAFIRTTNIYDDSRATKEITALSDAGYRVVVLGWDRNGEAEEKTMHLFAGMDVECRFFQCILPTGIGMRNIDKLIKWVRWIVAELNNVAGLYAVHACNLDGGIGAYRFCKKTGVPLIYDIYDYYIDSHHIPGFLKKAVERMEIDIIDHSEATIICTEERREQIKKSHPKKVIVIHNSPDVPESEDIECIYDYAYCGSLCDMRLIKEILDGYKEHDGLRFAFAGNDKYQKEVEDMAGGYEQLDYFGTVPYSEVLEIEKKAKVLSAIYEPSIRNHRLCAPNKFYEALALGKPLIVCRNTGIDKVVEENRLGIVIDYDAEAFYEALGTLIADDDMRAGMGSRARSIYENKYRWTIMKSLLIETYASLQTGRKV